VPLAVDLARCGMIERGNGYLVLHERTLNVIEPGRDPSIMRISVIWPARSALSGARDALFSARVSE
jgi:hypothetical protein